MKSNEVHEHENDGFLAMRGRRHKLKRKGTLLAFVLGVGFMLAPILAQQARGQVLYGSLVGTVTDQTGAVVPGATVAVKNANTGLTRETTTDAAGFYSIGNLQEGTYDLSVSKSGFKPSTQKGVGISINTVSRINASLEVGAVTESITVEASAAVLQTETSDVKTDINPAEVNNLPLTNYRNFQSLINLVPGATPGRLQNAITDTPGRALTTNVNGQDRGANNTRLDGSADILVTMPHHAVYVPPVESIETVNISTNNFDAEQGMTGGAAVTVVTKSGTNEFHGSLFAMHDDSALRTFQWNENRAGVDKKPTSIRNIGGGSIGGPIKKNKLFFFADWEGTFERTNRATLASVPREDLRTGDFTRIFGDTTPMIFDPYTGDPDGDGTDRTPFSVGGRYNIIPADRLNDHMKPLLDLVPLPNQPGDVDNYFISGGQRLNRNNIDAKVNWNRNEKHQLWVKYSVLDALVHGGPSLGEAGGECLCDGGNGDGQTRVQVAAIGQTYTVSPTFLIDGTLGWTRFGQAVESPDLGTNFGSDVMGIPGTNGPDRRESGLPIFDIAGYSTLGNTDGWSPIYRNDQSYTLNTNASWMKGAHEIRFGFDFVHHLMNHWQPELGRGPRGGFSFERDVTTNGVDGTDFNALAAFLIGAPQSSGKSSQLIKMDSLENQYALYVRDRWRATPKLTLNLGLRWELYPNRRRSAGLGIESYDPTTNEALIGGRGSVPRDNGVGYSKKLFAPRVGFAYQLTNSTVIRGGYGITYHSHPWGAQALRGWFPLTVVAVFEGVNGYQPVTTSPGYVDAGVPNAPLGTEVGGTTVGIPSILGFDISPGRIQLPLVAETGYPAANQMMRRGYIQSWNFIIEHKLPGELVTSVGYVGSRSVRGFAFLDINASQTIGSGDDGRPLFPTFGRTAATRLWDGMTNSNYHSLQVSLNRRFTGGLLLKGAYTYSRAINTADYSDWTDFVWQAQSVLDRNRGPAGYNIPHNFQLAYVYELPFGSGKKWASSGASKAVLGGWQINGIFSSFQGQQYTLYASDTSLNMPGNAQTPDQVKATVAKLGNVGDDGTFFDTSAFAPVTEERFGTVGRNTMRGPGLVNMDFSLFRTFKLTEKFNLQFRAEAFNLSNTPHFGVPGGDPKWDSAVDADVSSESFGKVTSVLNDPRQFRFGLRLSF